MSDAYDAAMEIVSAINSMGTQGDPFERAVIALEAIDKNIDTLVRKTPTLRDQLAIQFATTLVALRAGSSEEVAARSYRLADAMLAEREKRR